MTNYNNNVKNNQVIIENIYYLLFLISQPSRGRESSWARERGLLFGQSVLRHCRQ